MSTIGGISSNYYSTYNNYSYSGYSGTGVNTWTENANQAAEQLKQNLGIDSTGKTSSSSSTSSSATTASSTSGFLMGYQMALEDLESASENLKVDTKNNVFSKLDSVWNDVVNGKATKDDLETALNNVVSAVKDFADKYNYTVSYLKKNTEFGSGVSSQLDSLQRSLPSEKALKTLGMSVDTNGNLQVDETKLKEALVSGAGAYIDDKGQLQNGITFDQSGNMQIDSNGSLKEDENGKLSYTGSKDALTQGSNFVRDTIGGQYGIADRVGGKATSTLDSSVDKILGSDSPEAEAIKEASKSTATTYGSAKKQSMMSDSFLQFASFARSGAYNLTNYYAVSMLNMLV